MTLRGGLEKCLTVLHLILKYIGGNLIHIKTIPMQTCRFLVAAIFNSKLACRRENLKCSQVQQTVMRVHFSREYREAVFWLKSLKKKKTSIRRLTQAEILEHISSLCYCNTLVKAVCGWVSSAQFIFNKRCQCFPRKVSRFFYFVPYWRATSSHFTLTSEHCRLLLLHDLI